MAAQRAAEELLGKSGNDDGGHRVPSGRRTRPRQKRMGGRGSGYMSLTTDVGAAGVGE
jgi:hypothetical protein